MKKKVLFYILAVGMLCFGGCQNKGQADEPAPMAELTATSTPMPTATDTVPNPNPDTIHDDYGIGTGYGSWY